MRHYLDHNATSPLRPVAAAAMIAAFDICGNASSVHAEGRLARKSLDDAREKLALKLGCLPQMLVFTSGGTEANNMALRATDAARILVGATEHPSVLAAANGQVIPVNSQGQIDLDALSLMLEGPKALVSIMLANNETGVINDIWPIAQMVSKLGHYLHVDAVQAFGKMPVNFGLLGCDLMSVAAHKVGGPKGVGALIIRDGLPVAPLLQGGGQELRRRAGSENLSAIAGFAAVAKEPDINVADVMEQLLAGLSGAVIFGQDVKRLQNTLCFSTPGYKAETLLMKYDLAGIALSSGSACSSGKVSQSHVLAAMGVPTDLSQSALRISLGWNTTNADIEAFLSVTEQIKARARSA